MPSIEAGSKWKMPSGETLTVIGMVVSPFKVVVTCTSDQFSGREVYKPSYLARGERLLHPIAQSLVNALDGKEVS